MNTIRRAADADVAAIAAIQRESPEMSQWDAAGYEVWVAESAAGVTGFLAARTVVPGEHEILNLGVKVEYRRRGAAQALLRAFLESHPGVVYLEVRESNAAAVNLYKSMGFEESGRRNGYYSNPPETAIVLKFHSC